MKHNINNSILNQISSIYYDNFPYYLRQKLYKFKKSIKTYYYIDLLYDDMNKNILGFALLNYYPCKKMIHLDYFALDKKHQGNGNGSKYLKYIIERYCNNNILYFILECEDFLLPFYKKNNFEKIKINYKYNDILLNLMIYKNNNVSSLFKLQLALYLSEKFLENCNDVILYIYKCIIIFIFQNIWFWIILYNTYKSVIF